MNDNSVNQQNVNSASGFIRCPKCGAEMKADARYCMKCGNLNYAHPANETMKQYAWQNIKDGYFVAGANINDGSALSIPSTGMSSEPIFKTCLIVNVIIHLVLACLSAIPLFIFTKSIIWCLVVVLVYGIIFLFNYSFQCIYIKAHRPWWAYYVPLYNLYVFFDIAMSSGWMFLLTFIPIVGLIFMLVAYYKLGKKFYKNGVLTLLFPFVMIPVIGLDKDSELSIKELDGGSFGVVDLSRKTKSEKDYSARKFFIAAFILIGFGLFLYFAWPYIEKAVREAYEYFKILLETFE